MCVCKDNKILGIKILSVCWPDQQQGAEIKQGKVHKRESIKTGTKRIFKTRQTKMQQDLPYKNGVVVVVGGGGDYRMCLQKKHNQKKY
jgi:hypothetical protein